MVIAYFQPIPEVEPHITYPRNMCQMGLSWIFPIGWTLTHGFHWAKLMFHGDNMNEHGDNQQTLEYPYINSCLCIYIYVYTHRRTI